MDYRRFVTVLTLVFFGFNCICVGKELRNRRSDDSDTTSVGQAIQDFLNATANATTSAQNVTTETSVGANQSASSNALNTLAPANKTGQEQSTTMVERTTENANVGTNESTISATTTQRPSSSTTLFYPSSTFSLQTAEMDKCYTDAVLQNFCEVPEEMTDVSFWDLYSVMFSDTVLDALMTACTDGDWCLHDRFDYWVALIEERVQMVSESQIGSDMCRPDMRRCLMNIVENYQNCSAYEQMFFTSEAIGLVCDLKTEESLPRLCYQHVIESQHVTLADILRRRNGDQKTPLNDATCEAPETMMTKSYICVVNSCQLQKDYFSNFKPWSWFTGIIPNLITACNLNTTSCESLLQNNEAYSDDMATLIGVSVATMVTALTLTFLVCMCYKRRRRDAVLKDGYQQLLNEGDES